MRSEFPGVAPRGVTLHSSISTHDLALVGISCALPPQKHYAGTAPLAERQRRLRTCLPAACWPRTSTPTFTNPEMQPATILQYHPDVRTKGRQQPAAGCMAALVVGSMRCPTCSRSPPFQAPRESAGLTGRCTIAIGVCLRSLSRRRTFGGLRFLISRSLSVWL